MRVQVQFFSRLKDIAGAEPLELELPEGATVQEALHILFARWPALETWNRHLLVAVGLDYVGRDYRLGDGETLSVMPPVQGG